MFYVGLASRFLNLILFQSEFMIFVPSVKCENQSHSIISSRSQSSSLGKAVV